MFTTKGGVDIEEVAETDPDALVYLHVDPLEGFQPWQARRLVYGAGVEDAGEQKQIASIIGKLYETFVATDAMLCEINPLIVTPDGEVKALDSKFTVDDNALYKHADIAEMRDVEAADPLEALAREKGVTYVKLDGEVGILGNGAGLVMSTLDVIALAGGRPANFCDLGGGGDAEGVVDALEVITRDPQVKSIFFNIFGGITRCDEVARGILAALERMTIEHPIVVRLDGTNAEEGRKILAEAAPPNLHVEATMLDGARRAVELVDDERRLVGARRGLPRTSPSSARARTSTGSSSGRPAPRRRSTSRRAAATSRGGCARPGSSVVSADPAPGMQPDVICRAEDLPFADGAFDLVVTRIAPHHFDDIAAAVAELARVSGDLVDRRGHALCERAGRARPRSCATRPTSAPTRSRSGARSSRRPGLEVEAVEQFEKPHPFDAWMARAGTPAEDVERVRELLADLIEDDDYVDEKILLQGEEAAT